MVDLTKDEIKVNGMIVSTEFVKKIDELAIETGGNYIDVIVEYCQRNNIEIETAAAIIKSSPLIKSRVQIEAENLNILQKTARLPIDD